MIKHRTACLILILLATSMFMVQTVNSQVYYYMTFICVDTEDGFYIENVFITINRRYDVITLASGFTNSSGMITFALQQGTEYEYWTDSGTPYAIQAYPGYSGHFSTSLTETKNTLVIFMKPSSATPVGPEEPFVQPTFEVEGNGTVDYVEGYQGSSSVGPLTWGDAVTVWAFPDSGARFAYFKRNGLLVSPAANPTTFENLTSGEVFTAVFKSIEAPIEEAEVNPNAVNLFNFPHQLALALTIPEFAGGLLASLIMMALFMFPTLFICARWDKDVVFPALFVGFGSLALTITIGWMPVWVLLIICLFVALMFAGSMRDWITGKGRG